MESSEPKIGWSGERSSQKMMRWERERSGVRSGVRSGWSRSGERGLQKYVLARSGFFAAHNVTCSDCDSHTHPHTDSFRPTVVTVASLGLVSPGAATDGVTPFFLEKKLTTFFSHRPLENDDFFSCRLTTTPILLTSFIQCSF